MISSRGVLHWQAHLLLPHAEQAGKGKESVFHTVPGYAAVCFWGTLRELQGLKKAISKRMAAKFPLLNLPVM